MAKKQLMLLVSLMLVLSVFLAACTDKGGNADGDKKDPEKKDDEKEEDVDDEEDVEEDPSAGFDFPLTTTNSDAIIEDGELTYALVSDTPFEGTLNPVFYSENRMLE